MQSGLTQQTRPSGSHLSRYETALENASTTSFCLSFKRHSLARVTFWKDRKPLYYNTMATTKGLTIVLIIVFLFLLLPAMWIEWVAGPRVGWVPYTGYVRPRMVRTMRKIFSKVSSLHGFWLPFLAISFFFPVLILVVMIISTVGFIADYFWFTRLVVQANQTAERRKGWFLPTPKSVTGRFRSLWLPPKGRDHGVDPQTGDIFVDAGEEIPKAGDENVVWQDDEDKRSDSPIGLADARSD